MLVRKNDSGRSIVEMLGVLAIMGVITVMGISGYSQAIGKINRNNAVEQVTKLAQEVRGMFSGRASYNETDSGAAGYVIAGEDNAIFNKMKYKLTTPFGGNYKVTSYGTAGNNPGFIIEFGNVPQDDCLYFTTMAWTDVMTNAMDGTPGSSAYADGECASDGDTIKVYFR